MGSKVLGNPTEASAGFVTGVPTLVGPLGWRGLSLKVKLPSYDGDPEVPPRQPAGLLGPVGSRRLPLVSVSLSKQRVLPSRRAHEKQSRGGTPLSLSPSPSMLTGALRGPHRSPSSPLV